jgi:hypothetical protein
MIHSVYSETTWCCVPEGSHLQLFVSFYYKHCMSMCIKMWMSWSSTLSILSRCRLDYLGFIPGTHHVQGLPVLIFRFYHQYKEVSSVRTLMRVLKGD